MDSSIYLGMSGAQMRQLALQSISNNLANINTVGFRADLEEFRAYPTDSGNLSGQVFSVVETAAQDFEYGTMAQTDRELDVAIDGDGWFAIQSPSGKEAYTRAGNFTISPQGLLTTPTGQLVLGNSGPIAIPPANRVSIGMDGTITIIPKGSSSSDKITLDQLKLVKPEHSDLQKGEDGLFHMIGDANARVDGSVKVRSGWLEGSNVNAVSSLVNMINLSREYEMEVKVMQTAEEDDTKSQAILEVS